MHKITPKTCSEFISGNLCLTNTNYFCLLLNFWDISVSPVSTSKNFLTNIAQFLYNIRRHPQTLPTTRRSHQNSIDKFKATFLCRKSWYDLCPSFGLTKSSLKKIRCSDAFVMFLGKFKTRQTLLKIFLKTLHSRGIEIFESFNKSISFFNPFLVCLCSEHFCLTLFLFNFQILTGTFY